MKLNKCNCSNVSMKLNKCNCSNVSIEEQYKRILTHIRRTVVKHAKLDTHDTELMLNNVSVNAIMESINIALRKIL